MSLAASVQRWLHASKLFELYCTVAGARPNVVVHKSDTGLFNSSVWRLQQMRKTLNSKKCERLCNQAKFIRVILKGIFLQNLNYHHSFLNTLCHIETASSPNQTTARHSVFWVSLVLLFPSLDNCRFDRQITSAYCKLCVYQYIPNRNPEGMVHKSASVQQLDENDRHPKSTLRPPTSLWQGSSK